MSEEGDVLWAGDCTNNLVNSKEMNKACPVLTCPCISVRHFWDLISQYDCKSCAVAVPAPLRLALRNYARL